MDGDGLTGGESEAVRLFDRTSLQWRSWEVHGLVLNYLRVKSLLPADIFKGTNMSESLLRASRKGYVGFTQFLSSLTRQQRDVFNNNTRKMKEL